MEQGAVEPREASATAALPPGPQGTEIEQITQYLQDPLDFQIRLHREFGDVFTASSPFSRNAVHIVDPQAVKELFTASPEVARAGEAHDMLEPSLGQHSLLTLDGAPHLRQRKLLLPPFHGERMQRYGELIREATLRDIEAWPVGKPFALHPRLQRITLDVILRAVFGINDAERLVRFEQIIKTFEEHLGPVSAFPALRGDSSPASPWTRFLRAREALDAFIYEEIALRRTEATGGEADDILFMLLQTRHEDGSPMSDVEIRDELVTLLTAGHDTSAAALAWMMERLLRSPQVMARLRESLAADENDYMNAVIRETLRARPIISDVTRKLSQPLRIGGHDLPSGTLVVAAVVALHHRDDLFPDPDEFRPARFLEGKADAYAWIPFGGGVRRCIGAAFAEYEMRVVVRTILERAKLRAPDPKPEKATLHNITLAPADGTRVSLDRRLS
jgi:cytochrome P450 family 135